MKLVKLSVLLLTLTCLGALDSFADRLYIWTDANGEKHISQQAPPPDGVLTDIMDYRSRPRNQPKEAKPKLAPVVPEKQKAPIVPTTAKTCILNAAAGKVNVTVWDYDSAGNRQNVIFRGWLEKGQQQSIKSQTGNIVFRYQKENENKSYGHNRRVCGNEATIAVP